MREEQDSILKIEVTGETDAIPIESFLELVSSTISVLQDLDASISQSENANLEWQIVAASLNSPLMLDVKGSGNNGADVINAYLSGIGQIEKDASNLPLYFTETAYRKTKRLASVLNAGIKRVAFSTANSVPIVPTKKTIENIAVILETNFLQEEHIPTVELRAHSNIKEEMSTLVGTLETVSVHGKKPKFVIYDPLTNDRVDCYFPDELYDEVKAALPPDTSTPTRVSVTGTAKYNRQGHPISIEVESFKRLRSRNELPSWKDVEGINFSGAVDPTEYIRRLRNG